MPRYNDYVIERVAEAIYNAAESLHINVMSLAQISGYTEGFGHMSWNDAVASGDNYTEYKVTQARDAARAALEVIDSLYESEAEEPVEYAGIEGGL
jgi:hypothetical protein